MKIQKIMIGVVWNDGTQDTLRTFWQQRGVIFKNTPNDVLKGSRGSWFGNLTTSDMSKLRAQVTIEKAPNNSVHCILDVNTLFQDITEWNTAYWVLELETMESVLLHNDAQEVRWQELLESTRKAFLLWTCSFGMLGRKLTPNLRRSVQYHEDETVWPPSPKA